MYFKACRIQSTFKERTVQEPQHSRTDDLPVIMTNLSLLALKNQRKLITRMTDSLVAVLKYLIEDQAPNQGKENYFRSIHTLSGMAGYYGKQDFYYAPDQFKETC